jgi:vacuolar-type H+-ATPase subunit B/Vma2
MSYVDHRQFESALDTIDIAILPSLSRLLDGVIESAALAEDHSAGLRKTARQVEQLTRLIALVAPHQRAAAPNISA